MSDENELNSSAGSFSSRSSPRSFDMPGGAASLPSSSGVVARLFVASRAVVVSPCLACLRASRAVFLPASPPCLLAIRSARSALSSYRPAPRSFDKWDGAIAVAYVRVYMVSRNVICLSFLLYISHSCYISGVLVIYLAFLLYISHSCYMPGIFVIYLVFLLYQPVSCYTIL